MGVGGEGGRPRRPRALGGISREVDDNDDDSGGDG